MVTVKPLEWSQSMVFGSLKRRGSSPFGEWTAFIIDGLTEPEIREREEASQAAYAELINSIVQAVPPVAITDVQFDEIIGENVIGGTDDFPAVNRAALLADLSAAMDALRHGNSIAALNAAPAAEGKGEPIGHVYRSSYDGSLCFWPADKIEVWQLGNYAERHPEAYSVYAVPQAGGAVADIAAERERQKSVEGWTAEHDDAHDTGQMAGAAACYALTGAAHWGVPAAVEQLWPWTAEWWKPTTIRRNLVKAGALIAAEIERLDRAVPAQDASAPSRPRLPQDERGWEPA